MLSGCVSCVLCAGTVNSRERSEWSWHGKQSKGGWMPPSSKQRKAEKRGGKNAVGEVSTIMGLGGLSSRLFDL